MINIGGRVLKMWHKWLATKGVEQAHANAEAIRDHLAYAVAVSGKEMKLEDVLGDTWRNKESPRLRDLKAEHLVALYTFLREQGVCFDYTALLTQETASQQRVSAGGARSTRRRSLIRVGQSVRQFDPVRSPDRRAR